MTNPNSATYPPGFMVLHGNRLEDLRDLLTQFLLTQPLAPLMPEVVLVQSNGMKHWLELALADDGALGISAATRIELPASYLWQIYRRVLGSDAVPQHMPFDKDGLLWRLVRLLPVLAASNPVYAPLARYLGDKGDGRKLYQLAQQVADVLDGYQSYRADWLNDWAGGTPGTDLLRAHDGAPVLLDEAHAWQAQLWRDLRSDVGEALADASRASVHGRFMLALKALIEQDKAGGQRPAGLPLRIIVFGISSLSMQTVEALAELGQLCQVLMLVQNPCQYYWGDIVEGHERLRQQVRRRQQAKPLGVGAAQNDEMHTATHPLLASWGKQGRDYLHLLDNFDKVEGYRDRVTRVDAFVDPVAGVEFPSQLQLLQSSLLNLQPQPASPRALTDDASISFVTTHSAQREVEVLHDRLLGWFDADAQLQPRDVMVMVPDMETFAPHIQAVFGRFAPGQPRHIPYSVADTTARQSPMVQALDQILSLPGSRISLADWLSLFEVAAVRQRFGVTEGDVEQLLDWLNTAGVRWGLDAKHRRAWGVPEGVPGLDQNTWAFGLRRLLLGYAVGDGEPWAQTVPQAGLGGLDAALVSALLDWVDAVSQTLQELSVELTPALWGNTLVTVVARFFEASDDAEERLLQRLLDPLEVWQQACQEARLDTPLPLEVVREHWLSQIEEVGLHQRFFGGGVQFGTLMPMRSIPFQVICLIGMNDGDYPRQSAARDFDLMAQSWRAGDRSRREDDRYLFLEALLSARKKLYVSWQGHRATDNAERPPSVLVAQLIDYLNACWTPARAPQQHPLQPYSEAYFLQGSAFATYDLDWAVVHAANEPGVPDEGHGLPRFVCNDENPDALTLDDLQQLVRHPVQVFFRARMRVKLEGVDEQQQEAEPFTLNHLQKFNVGQALLKASDASSALHKLQWSGQLPMSAFGDRQAAEFEKSLRLVLARQDDWRQQFAHALPAQSIALSVGGVAITGNLTQLWSGQDGAVAPGAGTALLQLNTRLGAVLEGKGEAKTARGHVVVGLWVNHVMACASGLRLHSALLGIDGQVVFNAMEPQEALAIVQRWLQVYRAAWERPLPVACKTGWAFLQAQAKAQRLAAGKPDKDAKDPHEAARAMFEKGFQDRCELNESPYLARAFERYDDIEQELPAWAELLYGDMARHVAFSLTAGVAA